MSARECNGNSVMSGQYARNAIDMLLHVYALACMTRGSGNTEHLTIAANWLPAIEQEVRNIRRDIEEHTR